MGHPSDSPEVSRETLDGQLVSNGWMSWAETPSILQPFSGALWHGPDGVACSAELPEVWPFTSRMHVWGNGSMWRILGDPRSDQVLVTQLRLPAEESGGHESSDSSSAAGKPGKRVVATPAGVVTVPNTAGTCNELTLQRWQVRRKTPQGVDAAIEFLGPLESGHDSTTSEPGQT